jgi:hypothetical protein
MNSVQIEFCAENILDKMWMYSLEDIQLCLDRGAIGEYGTIYNRIDPATILAWFPMYDAQRQLAVDTINQEDKQQNNIYELFNNPQMTEAMQDVVTKIDAKMLQTSAQESTREQPSQLEIALMREYDALPQWNDDMRFRVYKNKPFQFTEFRIERYRELIEQQNEY